MKSKSKLIWNVSLLILGGFLITSIASYLVARATLRSKIDSSELPLTSNNIYSEIQQDILKPVFISSLMASDTFLRDWVLDGEKDESEIQKYLNEIHEKYNTVTSFFVSDVTLNYYHFEGIIKRVHPDSSRDKWYFRTKQLDQLYETNVDADMANNDMTTIFVNHKVFDYSGRYIGATGIGLGVTTMAELIREYQEKYQRNIYFIDQSGDVVLHSYPETETIQNIKTMTGLAEIADDVLTQENSVFSYPRDGKTIHLKTRFIPELKWLLMVEQEEDASLSAIIDALKLNFLIILLVGGVIITLINLTINAYRKKLDAMSVEDKKLRKINAESGGLREMLLDIITHDLTNPASTIYSMSELALYEFPENEYLDLIHRSSQNLLSVLKNTTTLSRAAFGDEIPKEKLNLKELLSELETEFASYLHEADMELRIDVPQDLIITANPLISEIFKNYLSNAIKYASEGKQVIISATRNNTKVTIEVSDFGNTIPETSRIQIFERKAQLEGSQKQGRGLGLAIVKRLAEAHGGEAWVRPNSPTGNRFCVSLPQT